MIVQSLHVDDFYLLFHICPKAFRDLTYITRDGLSLIITRLIVIVTDKLSKLLDTVRIQVIKINSCFIIGSGHFTCCYTRA